MSQGKNELKNLYDHLKKAEQEAPNFLHYEIYSENIDFCALIRTFEEIENQDSPDGIIFLDDVVYMVEHFQTSAYPRGALQEAENNSHSRDMAKSKGDSLEFEIELIPNFINWKKEFAEKLCKHMKHYSDYVKNTCKQYPGRRQKFVLLLEDISEMVIGENGYTVLEIEEFVEEILGYPEIDGVILCVNNPCGYKVIAEEREKMESNIHTKIERCKNESVMMYIEKIFHKFSPEDQKRLLNKIRRVLVKESFSMLEDMEIEKKP